MHPRNRTPEGTETIFSIVLPQFKMSLSTYIMLSSPPSLVSVSLLKGSCPEMSQYCCFSLLLLV